MSVKLTKEDALKAISEGHGLLANSGWIDSYISRLSVDAAGKPLAWYTYASLSFLGTRLKKDMSVFEFGSGYSTLWYASRVGRVVSVEHDQRWFDRVHAMIPANVTHEHHDIGPYAASVLQFVSTFDVIAVDGVERSNCVLFGLECLNENGVVVFDNSTDTTHQEGYDILAKNGFRRIDFHGLTPICAVTNCTSIFYRDNNCLGI